MSFRQFVGSAILSVSLLAASASATTWVIDATHSSAGFAVKHLVISNVRGEFTKFQGQVDVPGDDLTKAVIEATIDVASVDTRDAKRDDHLKSADFFDAATFPTMTFKSKKVEKAGDGRLKATGDLTLRGVTKEVVLDIEGPTAPIQDPWGNTKMGASATTRIDRKDFGISWNKTLDGGGLVVADAVFVTLDLELTKEKVEAAPPAVTPAAKPGK